MLYIAYTTASLLMKFKRGGRFRVGAITHRVLLVVQNALDAKLEPVHPLVQLFVVVHSHDKLTRCLLPRALFDPLWWCGGFIQ